MCTLSEQGKMCLPDQLTDGRNSLLVKSEFFLLNVMYMYM
jgi:hypothetical protein